MSAMDSETATDKDADSIPRRQELDSVALEADAVAFLQAAQEAVAGGRDELEHVMGEVRFRVKVPPLGEGDRGIVYRLVSHSLALPEARGPVCLKVAKQQPVCRERLLEEQMTTDFFLSEGVSVPRIHYMDPKGRFCVKDLVEGESITSLYLRFSSLSAHAQSTILRDLTVFMEELLALFKKRPDCQVSISPNNIYILTDRGRFHDPNRLVLIDPGTTLKKKYDSFTFETYWNEVLPDRIQKYQRTGYLQWLVPQQVTQSEGVSVPRIHYMDPKGRFCVKDLVEGESITSLYLRFSSLSAHAQSTILRDLKVFMEELLALFKKRPDCQVSISPNNIYVLTDRGRFHDPNRLVLIDPGTTLKKKYDSFTFETYWNEVLPDRIQKYQRTGYLQWLVPQQVTQSEGDEAREFEIFHGMKPSEVYLLLKAARTVELDAEEVIVKEGAIGENFYLVLEGEVEARRGTFSQPGAFHTRIRKGSVLGEMAFLLHVPRSMTVVAATPCKLIEFDRALFSEMLDAQLAAPYKLMQNMAKILAHRLYSLDQEHQKVLEARVGAIG